MQDNGITKKIEELSEALVFAEPSDLQALAGLHTQFEEIGEWADRNAQPEAASAAKAAASLIESVILGEVSDPKASLEVVGRAVSAMQAVICEGRSVRDARFPEELDLGSISQGSASGNNAGPSSCPEQNRAPSGGKTQKENIPQSGAPQPETKSNSISEPNPLEGDLTLLGEFVNEATEHLDAADMHLLTLETEPENGEALNSVFRAFHTIKGVAGFLMLSEIGSLAHEAENLLDRVRKGEMTLTSGAMDVVFDAVDALKLLVSNLREALGTGKPLTKEESLPGLIARLKAVAAGTVEEAESSASAPLVQGTKLGEILVESGTATQENVETALRKQEQAESPQKLGELLVHEGQVAAKDVAHALRTQKSQTSRQAAVQVKETVKVDADRLDRLLDTIGELVIAESMVSQANELKGAISARLARHLSQLDKITRELQEMGTSLRMVPVRSAFQKMARLARDLSKKANKEIEFVTTGEDTELDKTVVDKIGDPLVHMVRNAVDHGIEATAEERRRAGKPATGRVELRAYHKAGNIYIEIEDDGRGLDREAILAKARERGMLSEEDSLSEREIFNLIFEPGFSTAKVVTDVSGRGVGMDVVRRNIEALRGQVEIKSEVGKGSLFTIRLPLTLAIIDGMVIGVAKERYIIPTLSIVMSIRPKSKDISTVLDRGEMFSLQGKLIPLFRLDRLFGLNGAEQDPTRALVVVVESDGRQAGLVTDGLLGQQQIVIKTLGEAMRGIPGISGGAIMPDGRVGLILDVGGLVTLANSTNGNGSKAMAHEQRLFACSATSANGNVGGG